MALDARPPLVAAPAPATVFYLLSAILPTLKQSVAVPIAASSWRPPARFLAALRRLKISAVRPAVFRTLRTLAASARLWKSARTPAPVGASMAGAAYVARAFIY